jgi:hypothetical protein
MIAMASPEPPEIHRSSMRLHVSRNPCRHVWGTCPQKAAFNGGHLCLEDRTDKSHGYEIHPHICFKCGGKEANGKEMP